MLRTSRRALTVLAIVLAFASFAPTVASATTSDENLSAWMVNRRDRMPRGLAGLSMNQTIANTARAHSAAMARVGRLYHRTNLAAGVPTAWRNLGENVGVGRSLSDINTAFMNSSGHRANILCKCFRQIGVGIVKDARGYYWVTHIFYG